mgnify:CR=1 FL=1
MTTQNAFTAAREALSAIPSFYVTWETVTDESAEHRDVDARGYLRPIRYPAGFGIIGVEPVPLDEVSLPEIAEHYGFSLREALTALQEPVRPDGEPHSGSLSDIEASSSDVATSRCITCYYNRDFETGAFLSLSLHFPETISRSSRARIFRLLRS